MLKLLKVEYYRATRRIAVLALAAVMLFCALTNTGRPFSVSRDMQMRTYLDYYDSTYANQPEKQEELKHNLFIAVYAETYFGRVGVWVMTFAAISLTLSGDLRKRRIDEMIAAGHSRRRIFASKLVTHVTLCTAIPLICATLNYWTFPDSYVGLMRASDIGFMLFVPAYMVVYALLWSASWLPTAVLVGSKNVRNIIIAAVYQIAATFITCASWFGDRAFNPKLSVADWPASEWIIQMMPVLVTAAAGIALAWVLFNKKTKE